MILDFIIQALAGILIGILGVLPIFNGFPDGLTQALTTLTNVFKGANTFFPVDSLLSIALIVLQIEAGIYLFKLGTWIYNKIRGSS